MQYRLLKGTKVSEIGLGTWQLGSADWGVVDDQEAFSILRTFTTNGGNFIDTADVYGMGISEEIIGRFKKTVNEQLYVATKLGRRSDKGFGGTKNFTYDGMKQQVESSLENLDVPQLFLEQLHCIPTEELRKGDVFKHLQKLQKENYIAHWGVSVETSEEALICLEQEGLASIQIIFNLFRQHVADEVFAKAKDRDVALIVRVPLASGLLTGKFNENTTFPEKDHRSFNANGDAFNAGETFSGIEFSKGIELSREIATLLPDDKMAQWAIRWILDHPEVTTVIPGATKVAQVESNVAASGLMPLPEETHRKLRTLYNEKIKPIIRGHY